MKLIPLNYNQIEDIYTVQSHSEVNRWDIIKPPTKLVEVKNWLDNLIMNQLPVVALAQENKAVGYLGVDSFRQEDEALVAYFVIMIHPDYSNQGFGKLATQRYLSLFPQRYPEVKTMYATLLPDNIACYKLLTKLGFEDLGLVEIDTPKYGKIDMIKLKYIFN